MSLMISKSYLWYAEGFKVKKIERILGVKKSMILYHFERFGRGCDMGQGGWISGASQWLCDIGWLKISAELNIQPGPFYSSKKSILRGWKNYDFLVQPPVGVTGDKCSTSATSTQPVTCDSQTVQNGTVYQNLDYHRNHGITYNLMAFLYFSRGQPCILADTDLNLIKSLLSQEPTMYLDELQDELLTHCGAVVSIPTLLQSLCCLHFSCKSVCICALECNDLDHSMYMNWFAEIISVLNEYYKLD